MTIPDIPLPDKAAQLVFPGFKVGADDPAVAERLTDLGAGGFCLYGGTAAEVDALTRRLQARARLPLLFCADYEDGLAAHVSDGTGLPSNMALGASMDESLSYQKAILTAAEARAIGVRWVLAPVLDLATEPANPIVNVRAFGADPKLAGLMGAAYAKGLASEHVLGCAKHFPGHGQTTHDSHLELPTLRLTAEELLKRELIPYRAAMESAGAVMTAHLYVPGLCENEKTPVSLSSRAIGLLRQELGFRGLVTTDALNMNAVAANYSSEEACLAALKAGNDVLLAPADPKTALTDLPRRAEFDPAVRKLVEAAYERLMSAKQACGLWRDRGLMPPGSLEIVGSSRHRTTAERIASACLVRLGEEIKPGPISYLEPDADSPEEWQGVAFVEALRAQGISVEPYSPANRGAVVVGSFLRPRAYSGKITFTEDEIRALEQALSQGGAAGSTLVSFGSPFIFDQLSSWKSGLCAFGNAECVQRAAAKVIAGKAVATGTMPVSLARVR